MLSAAGEPGVFGEARLWNVADGKLVRTFQGHQDSLYAAVLSPDGKLLATSSYDQQIKLWDAATGKELRTLAGHNDAVFDLAFRPDGKILASASGDRTVKLWNVATGERLDTFGQPLKELYAVAFSPDGKRVAAGGVDNRIRVWQVSADGKENTNPILYSRFAHEGAVVKLVYSADGKTLVSAGEDRTVKIWDADNADRAAGARAAKRLGRGAGDQPRRQVDRGRPARRQPGVLRRGRRQARFPPRRRPSPSWRRSRMRGAQAGTTARIKLAGKHLADVTAVKTSHEKLAAKIVPIEQRHAGARSRSRRRPICRADATRSGWPAAAGESGTQAARTSTTCRKSLEAEPNDTLAAGQSGRRWPAASGACWPPRETSITLPSTPRPGRQLVFEIAGRQHRLEGQRRADAVRRRRAAWWPTTTISAAAPIRCWPTRFRPTAATSIAGERPDAGRQRRAFLSPVAGRAGRGHRRVSAERGGQSRDAKSK